MCNWEESISESFYNDTFNVPWQGTHEIDNSLWNSVLMHLNLFTGRWASKCRRGDWVMEVVGHRAQWVQTLSPVHVRVLPWWGAWDSLPGLRGAQGTSEANEAPGSIWKFWKVPCAWLWREERIRFSSLGVTQWVKSHSFYEYDHEGEILGKGLSLRFVPTVKIFAYLLNRT